MHFGKQIEEARKVKNWRQEDLAEALGVTQQAVQKWEAKEDPPRSQHLERLCTLLDLPFPELPRRSAGGTLLAPPDMFASDAQPQERVSIASSPALRRVSSTTATTGRLRTSSEVANSLRALLPPDIQKYSGAPVLLHGRRYPFPYVSSRVVVNIVFGGSQGIPLTLARAAAWRLMLMKASGSGAYSMDDKHYLLAVLPLAGDEGPVDLGSYLPVESKITGILIEPLSDMGALAQRIVELEKTPTEMEDFLESVNLDDDPFSDLI